MFSRKSSSHNLLFRPRITRAVSFAAPTTIREEDEELLSDTLSHGPAVSASAPLLTRPLSVNGDAASEEPAGGLAWFRAMTRKQKMLVAILCLANFSATVFYSCIAPFFPSYAMRKGATETEVGFVFGCFQLVIFFMSPIWGKYMHLFGAKFLFVTGILTTGAAAILMGFLEFCPAGRSFVIMCFVIRVVDAVGVSAFLTASFTVIANEFPTAISTIFGACETFNGLGYTLGPPIGGLLYQLGGFILPFAVLGSVVLLVGIASWLLVPSMQHAEPSQEDSPSYRQYLSIPGVWITLLSVFTATLGLGFLDAMYGPHLEEFHISPGLVGAIFLLPSVLYFICAPFLGVIVDRRGRALEFITLGAIISGSCYLFMGPAPFMHLQGKLWVLIIANIILGLGTCGQLIPPFGKNLEATINAGFPDNFETHGLVSGALSSATALGAFVGPSVGGFAVEEYGFSWTVTGIAFLNLIVVFVTVMYLMHEMRKASRKRALFVGVPDDEEDLDETSPLMMAA
ncbi:MFS-type transporter SLC18B1-like [Paramacrobiotus metropolitanus]|uniref:MFS-type transporter SLC18B1-like n=1 Tax=Paramacrobiotus metropolitanus TaxID=2943436 RepID=UPI0024463FFE|nr:MFS-type transporter SLC18B1-like [Paramacrobiotus metropolitanus]